jgi:hypothetical protein
MRFHPNLILWLLLLKPNSGLYYIMCLCITEQMLGKRAHNNMQEILIINFHAVYRWVIWEQLKIITRKSVLHTFGTIIYVCLPIIYYYYIIQSRSPSMPVRRLRVGIALEKSNWFTLDFQHEFYACSAIVAKYKQSI